MKTINISGRKNISKLAPEKAETVRRKIKNFNLTDDYYNIEKQEDLCRNLYMTELPKYDEPQKIILKEITSKLSSYKQQDVKNEIYSEHHIVNYDDTIDLLMGSRMRCKYCRDKMYLVYKEIREPKQWTLDRINNDYGHNKDNVLICCLDCNLKRRNTNMEKFLFTKQLKITRV